MGTGDYICVTLRGGAPWGFTLREGEGDTYRPFIVTQVDEDGRAFLAGVREDDEAVSLNGEPCADLTLLQALELIDTSIDCVQLLVKRYSTISSDGSESQTSCGERESPDVGLESTTLHIISSKQRPQSPRELFISESQDEVSCGELDSEAEFPNRPQLLCTELHAPSCGDQRVQEENEDAQRCLAPGDMVELQVSLSEQTLDNRDSTSLGCAIGIEGELSNREAIITIPTTASHSVQSTAREPLGQRGVVLSSPSLLGQVEVILQQQQPAASGAGRAIPNVGGPKDGGSAGSQSEGEEGGGHSEGVPGSLTVSFRIPSEEGTAGEEQDSDSEEDQDKPNKHRARHARLRRSESQSEKQLKEAKSKCKRIALLLTAAPPNPNNKGVLMFKKHRQRAKKYTLVSYGTGEDEPEFSDEEDEDNEDDKQGTHTVEFTLLAPNDSEIDKQFIADAQSGKSALTINWDKGLLEIERNLKNQAEMECLPETRGKGALMFAQRRLRMDEISAEHEELRRHGIPVEGVLEADKKVAEQSYMQSATESHTYMDVNMHQQSQQQQQYQQYQEQQYYEQQQNYQQQQQNYQHQQYQQQQQQYQQQYQQQQYEQQQYQQQQMYQQRQQEYHQEQQQMQHYATNINGNVQHQTVEMQSSFSNRTAKPFSAEEMVCTPYSPAMSGTNQEAMGQGEQIASRDERISTPAIKTGFLMDARKRNVKPMFTFKEAPKVSPNPALLNLLNKGDKKLGFESGPEEDYLSLGAEACNFLQSSRFKPKIPPPVAPKPVINPNSPPWSPQIEMTNPDMPQQAENSVSTPAVAPTAQTALAPELEPTPAPAPEPSPPPAPQEAPTSTTTEEQPTWLHQPESQQQPMQVPTQEENGHTNSTQPEQAPMTSWSAAQTQPQQEQPTNAWHPTQVQPQEPPANQSPPQPPWVTRQPPQPQAQVQPSTNTWNSQMQPSWGQSPEQAQAPTQAQPPWVQPQEPPHSQPQYQPPWAQTHEQANLQQMQPSWGQPQEPMRQQPQAPWAQAPQAESQPQPPWVTQQQQKPQPPWAQQVQPESQPQPPWVQQPQQQAPQQPWPQAQAPGQPQPPWASAQPQQQPQSPMSAWPPSQNQAQVQPPWVQATQAPPPPPPQTNLNPWAPVPPQADPQPSWAQPPAEHGQHPMNSWSQEQNPVQQQPPWAQPGQSQAAPQSNWQQSPSKSPPQPPMNTWPSAQTQPQTNAWTPQTQQTPANATSTLNPRPSPKPWNPPQSSPQSRTPPPPPQRMHSFTIGQRVSSPVNPMATVLLSSSQGPAFEMPVVRGKGADMFAKRQSRMEKFVVDSETVEANKASRSTSPVASLPNEWKYTPNVRAPPPRAYNPIQSPSYPPAATKQPPPGSPSSKAKKKGKEKPAPPPKQLNVIDVMKHQPYQLDSSLFLFGPAAEAAKAAAAAKAECPPPNPPVETQPFQYEQMAPVQQPGPYNAPYPQQAYGMPMQPMMHEGHYQQNQANVYPPPNPYQQPPGVPYQQMYNQQYQQPPPPPYQPQSPQSPNPPYQQAPYQQPNNSPYQQAPQAPYQPAHSPPYLAAPSVPYHQQPPTSFVAPSFPIAARPESASGGNPTTAPKPKFTAKKSSAQTFGRSYSLSPLARVPAATGQRSASSSPKPPSRASSTPPVRQTHSLEKGQKLPSPWQAASRHPLGLVDEAFPDPQNPQQSLASSIRMAAQRKILPEPPAEWKARVSYQAQLKTGSQTWGQSQSRGQRSRAQLPSFMSPTRSTAPSPASSAGYRSLPRQWQPQRSVTEGYLGPSGSYSEYKKPLGNQSYKSVYSSNTWSWKR